MNRELGACRYEGTEIRTRKTFPFVASIDRHFGIVRTEPASRDNMVWEYMGFPIIEDDRMEPFTAAIVSNGEIINIVNFA